VEVEKELSALLEKYWDPDLLTLYSRLRMASYDRMFQRCEKWLESHPEDPYLFYITGLLAFRCQIWGRARTYIEQSLKMDPHPETYVLMGQLLEELNEASLASNCFRQASIMLAERAQYDWYAFPKETACV
jgi:HemY protein